ncbi:MAG: hypothetical protein LAO20_11030 [Acidobacteriia bacterium]|nr:hypothetical protein [Terriglobia bacterium]
MSTLVSISALILDTTVKATVLLALAWAAGWLLKQRSASARHMVRTIVLSALLLLPFSGHLLPAWHVKGIPDFMPATALQPATASTLPADVAPVATFQAEHFAVTSLSTDRTMASPSADAAGTLPHNRRIARVAKPSPPARTSHEVQTWRAVDTSAPTSAVARPALAAVSSIPVEQKFTVNWPALALVWLLGTLLFATRWIAAVLRVTRLVRRATPLYHEAPVYQADELARALGIRRRVALRVSDEVDVPLAVGTLHPIIILPPDHHEWSELRRTAILNHELAHIGRLDSLAQAVAQVAAALYWFHPLVWLNVRAMRAEREHACDDHVLATGTKASDYAHELLDIVSELRRPQLNAALAMARRSQLEGRVLAVLNPAARRGAVSRGSAIAIAALVLAVVLPLGAMRPAQTSTPAAPIGAQKASSGTAASTPAVAADPSSASAPLAVLDGSGPVLAEAPVATTSDDGRLAELRARLAELQARMQDKQGSAEELQARVADLRAQLALLDQFQLVEAERAALVAQAAPSAPSAPAVPAAPGVPSAPAAPAAPSAPAAPGAGDLNVCGTRAKLHHMNMESNNNGGYRRWTASWSGDDCSVDLRSEGEITFNADAMEIQSISSGGYFEVSERKGSTLRYIKVTPSSSGLQYVYKINDKQQPFEGEAKTWFSSFLLALERSTGFAADTRVPRLLAKGGPNAVLDEINNLQGDFVRGRYFRKLLEQPKLPGPIVVRIINQAGQQITSDFELARVLMEVSKQYDLADEASRSAFLNATGKLKSDFEHSRVLIELLKRPNLSKENVRLALDSAASIKSDFEKSRILLSLLNLPSFDQSYLDLYLKMVASIKSDYEKSRDLLAPMQKYQLALNQTNQIMDATATISSDYEKSRLLLVLTQKGKLDEKQTASYLNTVDSMKSDFERSRSLLALLESTKLSNANLGKLIDAAGRIKSDFEKSRVLQAVARKYPLEGALRENYIRIADSIRSEFERNRVLAGIVHRATL